MGKDGVGTCSAIQFLYNEVSAELVSAMTETDFHHCCFKTIHKQHSQKHTARVHKAMSQAVHTHTHTHTHRHVYTNTH